MSRNYYGTISLTIDLIGFLIVIILFVFVLLDTRTSLTVEIFSDLRTLYAMPFAIAGMIFGIVGIRVDYDSKKAKSGLELGIALLVLSVLPQLLILVGTLAFLISGGW